MKRLVRAIAAGVVSVWSVAMPLFVLHCAAECDFPTTAAGSAPSCHHESGASGTEWRGDATSCGHNHNTAVSILTARRAFGGETAAMILPAIPNALSGHLAAAQWIASAPPDTSPPLQLSALTRPLRI